MNVLLLVLAVTARAQPPGSLQPTMDDALVVLEVHLGDTQLSDALEAQEIDGELYLPLARFAAALSLAIECDASQATATGFVLEPARSFHLDAHAGTVTIAGTTTNFDTSQIRLGADDIYVAHALISTWLPVDLQVDLPSLWLTVRPREPLPMQSRRQRERQAEALARASALAGDDAKDFPRRAAPYDWIEAPALDQTVATQLRRDGGGTRATSRLTTMASADLLQMEAAAYVATTPGEKDPVARLTLARHDPDAGLLGFAHARTAAIGSVAVAGVSNITESSPLGAGLHVSNYPLTRPERFDTQSISGPLPPGWDVELYHNDVLVGWRQADPSGIYDFAELALQFGRNDFKLVFRGPQGQFREETQHFQVGDTLTPSGAFYYRIAAHPWESAGVTALTQFDWGLSRQLSVAGGLTWLSDAAQPYASAGVRGIVAGMFISADAARSPAGDWRISSIGG